MAEAADPPAKLGDIAEAAGLRRIHILTWRDLDDIEAGGSEIHADEIASRWAAAGIEVVMRTSHAQGHLEETRRHGYRVIRRAGRHLVFLDAPMQEVVRRAGARDGLLEVWNGMPFFTPLWARGRRVTFVHHVHADMWRQVLTPGLARLGEAIELKLAPRLYRQARVLTPSESSRQEILKLLRLRPERVSAVPNGVSPAFTPGGVRSPHPLVVTVGRIVPHKRVDLLVEVVAEARRQVPDLELLVVGDGYHRPKVDAIVADLDAESWVTFTGRVEDDELVELYRRAWVVASASSAEGWGMTLSEAAACGTPAVATRIAGHLDVVDDGVSGLLTEGREEMAAAFVRMLRDDGLRAELGAGARRRAGELSWDRTAREVLEALAAEPAHHRPR